ncbi:hypothetical protein IP88_02315 [alpha proteobacterium AAP81b]|nr:hypothetical protein IP88_02315 [alpha proteobacterium AAP81b]
MARAAISRAPVSRAVVRAPRDTAHEGFLTHRRGLWWKVALALSLVVSAAYALIDQSPRPNGGTALGYGLGTLGALLILWLSLLGLRKRIITRGAYSLKAWTSAHVWLGLSLIVVGTLHSGFQFGWNVHTLAWGLMMIVILTGLYGIIVYARLPEQLSANRQEVTQPQMLEAIRALDAHLDNAAQPLGPDDAALVRLSLEKTDIGGSLRQRLGGSYARDGNARALAAVRGEVERQRLAGKPDQRLAQILFLLERKEAALAQARRHIGLKSRLEIWLYIHVPATFALLAALAAHITSVFLYW